jgi:SAM-dependent methyltransferase
MKRGVKGLFPENSWEDYYRRYQFLLGKDYLLPILRSWGVEIGGKKILEVGSGNGGCGEAFLEAGGRVTELEIDKRLVDLVRDFNSKAGFDINIYEGDICDPKCAALADGPFDIVLMRDVIEHIEKPLEALRNVRTSMKEDGVFFLVFPPYYSPFGAHQQILPRRKFFFIPYSRLPFVQLLPDKVFGVLTMGEDAHSAEVRRLRGIRLTIRKFEKHAATAGFRVRRRKFYLSRPTFSIRYGLPVIESRIIGRIPVVRELFVTGAYYLLELT